MARANAKPRRQRLDVALVERQLAPTKQKAQAYIMAKNVRVNGEAAREAGMKVTATDEIALTGINPYVGRGGYKLAGALQQFGVTVADKVCADVGACTGGFSDVLLQHAARRVYAIDVGYGQLAWKVRTDERVVVMERTNARKITSLPESIDLTVIDVSFISLKLILPAVTGWMTGDFDIIALIKPQFEAARDQVPKGGIIRNPAIHAQVLQNILAWCQANALFPHGLMRSPITGGDGNIEFLVWLKPSPTTFDWQKHQYLSNSKMG